MVTLPLTSSRRSKPGERRRLARVLLLALPLSACLGRSQDSHAPNDPASAGTAGAGTAGTGTAGTGTATAGTSTTGDGGAGAVAGAAAGGSELRAGAGGQSTAGTAGDSGLRRTFCWKWSDIENEPKPGETGISACPNFDELTLVVKRNCGYTVPNPEPIPEDSTAKGDCCYGVTDLYCR